MRASPIKSLNMVLPNNCSPSSPIAVFLERPGRWRFLGYVLNTTGGSRASPVLGAMFLDEEHGGLEESPPNVRKPHKPILLSESDGEMDDGDRHVSGREIGTQVPAHTRDAKRVRVDTQECRRPRARGKMLDEEYGDDAIDLGGGFEFFEPVMQLETGRVMDGPDVHGTGTGARRPRRQLFLKPSAAARGVRIVDVPGCRPPSVDVVTRGMTTRSGPDVPCKFDPQSERRKGVGVANVPRSGPPCTGTAETGKSSRFATLWKCKSNEDRRQPHALPLRLRLADHRIPYTELLRPDPHRSTKYGTKSSKALVARAYEWKAGSS